MSRKLLAILFAAIAIGTILFPASRQRRRRKTTRSFAGRKRRCSPRIPELAKDEISGTVKIEVVVAANGTVKEARIVGGHPVLATAHWTQPRNGASTLRPATARE